jgi:hypothetical protein
VSTARTVTCPACQGPSLYAPENAYRPFCSRRCKEHDFGAWANEEHRLPQAPSSDELDPDQEPETLDPTQLELGSGLGLEMGLGARLDPEGMPEHLNLPSLGDSFAPPKKRLQ